MSGYKQPPQHTQFKKGRSGNPKGRPKKSLSIPSGTNSANALVLKEARRAIKVREGDEIREMQTIEAVLRAQAKEAISGNAFAQRDIINRLERAEAEERKEIVQDCELWKGYVDRARKIIAETEAKGEPTPEFLPHPDDVIIDSVKGVSIEGPLSKEEAANVKRILEIRDLLIMQSILDERFWCRSTANDPLDRISSAAVLANVVGWMAPKRFQLSEREEAHRRLQLMCMTHRTLLKTLYRGWQAIGVPMRRGVIFPPARFLELEADRLTRQPGH